MHRFVFFAALFVLLAGCSSLAGALPAQPTPTAFVCPLSQQAFIPAEPIPEIPAESQFWFGAADLWTALPDDGIWWGLPRYQEDQLYGQKLVLWSQHFDMNREPQPEVRVTGRRLDGEAPLSLTDWETHGTTHGYTADLPPFMLVGIGVATTGCWEFTAEYKGHELVFVVQIDP